LKAGLALLADCASTGSKEKTSVPRSEISLLT
jgi:hypothetical protein